MLLNALQFSSYLSWLTLLIGESWRVRYVLIQCFTILQRAASDDGIRKKTSIRPAHLPDQMALHHLPSHSHQADVKGRQASPGNVEDAWPGQAGPDNPSTALSPLQTASQGLCTAVQHPWTHPLEYTAPQWVKALQKLLPWYQEPLMVWTRGWTCLLLIGGILCKVWKRITAINN